MFDDGRCEMGGRSSSKKPVPLLGIVGSKIRTCLKCDKSFGSRGPGNRICPKCTDHNADAKVSRTNVEQQKSRRLFPGGKSHG